MNAKRRLLPIAVAVVLTIPLLGVSNCRQFGVGSPFLRFEAPLPGTPAKKILMTVAWLDKQGSSLGFRAGADRCIRSRIF